MYDVSFMGCLIIFILISSVVHLQRDANLPSKKLLHYYLTKLEVDQAKVAFYMNIWHIHKYKLHVSKNIWHFTCLLVQVDFFFWIPL